MGNGWYDQAMGFGERPAIPDGRRIWTYRELGLRSRRFAETLLDGRLDLEEARVAFMIEPGHDYVCVQRAIWMAGGVAVPLCVSHPAPALEHVLRDTIPILVIAEEEFLRVLHPLCANQPGIRLLTMQDLEAGPKTATCMLPQLEIARRAMILYTSGTTHLPKGVVSTHANLKAQMDMLIEAWEWSGADRTICVLPLHHIHGIVNVVGCSLAVGAQCRFMPRFDAASVIEWLTSGDLTVFMAVPTIYFKLITYLESLPSARREEIRKQLAKLRLMVSGSAALPVSVMEKWYTLSGHFLLERYGMTEIGMAISNPYRGLRKPGHVGQPLPGVAMRLVGENGGIVEEEPGEIQVKGTAVFGEYWNNTVATKAGFTEDGWFRTGDTAVLEDGYYRILGRTSVDIIKSGGFKISALEIEELIRQYPGVSDCSVVGIPDEEWGEVVAVALVLRDSAAFQFEDLQHWLYGQLPRYKVPRRYRSMPDLPRNAMGKVTKKDLLPWFNVASD